MICDLVKIGCVFIYVNVKGINQYLSNYISDRPNQEFTESYRKNNTETELTEPNRYRIC